MSKQERYSDEFVGVPESAEAGLEVVIRGEQFWQNLVNEAVCREVNQLDLAGAILNLNLKMIQLKEGERMVFRDSAGFESPIPSFIEKKFEPQFSESIEGAGPRIMIMKFSSEHRDLVMETANKNGIILEDMGVRFMNLGLYVSELLRGDNLRLMICNSDGRKEEYPFAIRNPKERLKDYFEKKNKEQGKNRKESEGPKE